LVVELDGGHHAEQVEGDQRRSTFLEQNGYRVLRFWDNEVLMRTDAVLEHIAQALTDPHPYPLPNRARVSDKTEGLRSKDSRSMGENQKKKEY
jgi:hypothetical protein